MIIQMFEINFRSCFFGISLFSSLYIVVALFLFNNGPKEQSSYHSQLMNTRWIQFRINDQSSSSNEKPFFRRQHNFNCENILRSDHGEIMKAKKSTLKIKSEADIYQSDDFCDAIKTSYYFPTQSHHNHYPLAYVILLNEHTDFILKLIQAIYSPGNVYCLHVDLKASQVVYQNIQKLVGCFKNIIMTRSVPHVRSSWLALKPIFNCFQDLLTFSADWNHVVVLEGHDFPLRTEPELSYILQKYYTRANDIDLLEFETYRLQSTRAEFNNDGIVDRISIKEKVYVDVPGGIQFYKSLVQSCVLRSFAEFSLGNSESVAAIRDAHKQMRFPHESYFSTLVHNSNLGAPGAFPAKCMGKKDYLSRHSYWQQFHRRCKTSFRHEICIIGLDLLATINKLPHFFINKFYPDIEPVALECQHELIFNRTYVTPTLANGTVVKDIQRFYGKLSVPRYEAWKEKEVGSKKKSFQC